MMRRAIALVLAAMLLATSAAYGQLSHPPRKGSHHRSARHVHRRHRRRRRHPPPHRQPPRSPIAAPRAAEVPVSPAQYNGPLAFGVQDDATFVHGTNDIAAGWTTMRGLGASWLRINAIYGEPLAPRIGAAEAARAEGFNVYVTLTGNAHTALPSTTDYGAWCADAARELPAQMWSTWNEPDLWQWFPGTVLQYRDLYMACRAAIKSVKPDAPVLVGETSPHSVTWLDQLKQVGIPPAEGYAHHPYWTPDGDYNEQDLGQLRQAIGDMPLYLTEFGTKTDWSPSLRTTLACDAIAEARAVGARMFIWYMLYPSPGNWDTSLLNADGSPTAVYQSAVACSQ